MSCPDNNQPHTSLNQTHLTHRGTPEAGRRRFLTSTLKPSLNPLTALCILEEQHAIASQKKKVLAEEFLVPVLTL